MRRAATLVALTACAFAAAQYGPKTLVNPGSGQRVMKAPQSAIGVDQKLNDYVPMNLQFTDSNGKRVALYFIFLAISIPWCSNRTASKLKDCNKPAL